MCPPWYDEMATASASSSTAASTIFIHRAVVSEVHHFRALHLQNAAHDVDGGVVPVKKRRRGDDAKRRDGAGAGGELRHLVLQTFKPRANMRVVLFDFIAQRAQFANARVKPAETCPRNKSSRRNNNACVEPSMAYTAFKSDTSFSDNPSAFSRVMKAQPLHLVRAVHAPPTRHAAHTRQQARTPRSTEPCAPTAR